MVILPFGMILYYYVKHFRYGNKLLHVFTLLILSAFIHIFMLPFLFSNVGLNTVVWIQLK